MQIRQLMQFNDGKIEDVTLVPTVDDPKGIIYLSAPMTQQAAKVLGLEYIYCGGVPREGVDTIALDYEFSDLELSLPASYESGVFTTLHPSLIHKLKVKRIEDAAFRLSLRIHIVGRLDEVLDFFRSQNKQTFEFAIRPRQGELFEGGTRVEMASKSKKNGKPAAVDPLFSCPLCARDVPLTQDGTAHVDAFGEVIACVHPSAIAAKAMKASDSKSV